MPDPTTAQLIRIAIVEDDATTRDALVMLLSGEPTLELVRTFDDGQSLLQALDTLAIDVLLTDLGLPDIEGPALIAEVKARRPLLEVMAYTVSEARDIVFAALKAGATGYILKRASSQDLVRAFHTLASGGAPMSPRIARSVVRTFQSTAAIDEDYLLTARERDVVQELEKGRSYKEVGASLAISPHTVHSHIKKIYEKLHATSRSEAVRTARLKGLV